MKTFYELTLTCVCFIYLLLSNFIKLPFVYTILSFYLFFFVAYILVHFLAPAEKILSLNTNSKEKIRIRFTLITVLNLCLLVVSLEPYILSKFKLHTGSFYNLNNWIGYASSIVFLFCFLLLPAFKILRFNGRIDKYIVHLKSKEILQQEFELELFNVHRKVTAIVTKWLRKYHIPISLLGIGFVVYHVYMSLLSGFKANYTYISGYVALFDLLLLSLLGLLRFKRLDKNLHKILSYIFILLFAAHVVFSELKI